MRALDAPACTLPSTEIVGTSAALEMPGQSTYQTSMSQVRFELPEPLPSFTQGDGPKIGI